MTTRMRLEWPCHYCGEINPAETPFSTWCRDNLEDSKAGLVIHDFDLLVHRYMTHGDRGVQFLMMVEVKTRASAMTRSQRDSFALWTQAVRTHAPNHRDRHGRFHDNGGTYGNRLAFSPFVGRRVSTNILGLHLLQLSGDQPDQSEMIRWNLRQIDVSTLINLLNLHIHPHSFRPLTARRHKKQRMLPLFDGASGATDV